MSQFGNVVFIVWRESIEALLVIGILHAWLGRQGGDARRRGRLYLWAGVAAGLVAAIALGALIIAFSDVLDEDAMQAFQTALMLLASALIVQMVMWMRKHGRTLRSDLETALQGAADRSQWLGVALLAAIAVAREGSETVVFLAGTIAAARHEGLMTTIASGLAGAALAVATYALLQLGSHIFSWRRFFQVTEILLLLLAAALVLGAVDNLVGLGIAPRLSGRLWDTSMILPDSGGLGGLVAALTGYRARPDLTQVLVYALYWAAVFWLVLRPRQRRA